jgi:serine/threonine protein phosphatase PrpC
MKTMFSTLTGSTIGNYHKNRGNNSQDASAIAHHGQRTALVLADGCGAGAHSEVGAKLAVAMLAQRLAAGEDLTTALAAITSVLATVAEQICPVPDQYVATVTNYLLFTLVGAVLAPDYAFAFAIGDGVVAWQTDQASQIKLLTAANNAPDYLAYVLFGQSYSIWRQDWPQPPQKLLLASDGLTADVAHDLVPVLWHDDMWHNPQNLQRYLSREGRETVKITAGQLKRSPGRWRDDITVLLARPKQLGA